MKLNKSDVKKYIKDGYIRATFFIEVIAVSIEAAKNAIEKHVRKMENDRKCFVCEKKFFDIVEAKSPFENVKKTYSAVVEIEVLFKNIDNFLYCILNYAPSSVEVLEPKNIRIDIGELQGIANGLAAFVHKIAELYGKGILIST